MIGDYCFENVRVFELDELSELESVVIGEKSFWISNSERSDGSYRIVYCPKLKSIEIGYDSFWDYHSFELNNLPSLQSIVLGDHSFNWAPSFSLTDLPQLQSVGLGDWAFEHVHSIVFENLPMLQSIQLASWAFDCDNGNDRKTISYEPFNYKNTLTMRNLPSLTQFKGGHNNFGNMGTVTLENIPQLSSGGIIFDYDCFFWTYSLHPTNATALESVIRDKSKFV